MQSSLGWFRVAGWQKKLASVTTIFALIVVSAGPLAVLGTPLVASAAPISIFSDGFENTPQFTNPVWNVADPQWQTNASGAHAGSRKAQVQGNTGNSDDIIQRNQSTAGYQTITLSYWFKADSLESGDDDHHHDDDDNGDSVKVQWYNGSTWATLFTIDDSNDTNQWIFKTHTLPASANNNPNLKFRFVAKLDSGNDKVYLDDVSLTGEQMKGGLIVKKVVTNDNGGLLQASAFSFSINNAAPVAFEADGQNDFSVLPGSYSVVESASAGYATTYSGCSNISVVAGATTTCTITNNDKPAVLTVKKVVVGGTKTAADFAFSINNTTPIQFEADGQNDVMLNAGTYSVSELSTPANYAASYSGCSDIVLGLDGKATCTITNTYIPPGPSCNESASHSFVSDTTTLQGANPTVPVDIDLGTAGNQIHSAWTASIPGAQWIWGENPVNTPSVEISETFTKTFTVTGVPNADATLLIAADNSYSVDINGNIGVCADATEDNYSVADTCTIPVAKLLTGTNTLTFHVKNFAQNGGTAQSNPAGLLYKFTYTANECQNAEPICDPQVNLLKNPSFEATPVSAGGWNIFPSGAPSLDWVVTWLGSVVPFNDITPPGIANAEIQNNGLMSVTASAGSQWTELDSDWDGPSGSISGEPAQVELAQDIPTIPGKIYKVSYDFQARPDTASSESKIEALKNGVVMDTADGTVLPSGWSTRTYTFTATGATTNISFRDAGSPSNSLGALLDNTKVMCQPETPKGSVTICKYNTHEQKLSGWTLMLKGDKIEDVVVPTGTPAGVNTVASLNAGQSYIAVAKGTWNNQGGANPVDAEYSTTDGWLSQMDGYTGYGVGILELEINQNDGSWGPYAATHEYAQSFVPGTSGSANFRIFDGDTGTHTQNEGWFGDNSGSVDVSVYKGYAGVTGEDGCVTFANVPYGTYSIDELLKQNWTNQSGLGTVTVDSPTETFSVVNKDVSQPTTATIVANKIVCDSEADLPNWGAGGPDITSATASDYVESHPGCHLAEWTFEWAPSVATNPGDNVLGAVGGAWTAFTGSATIPAGALVWVREQMQPGYVPFTGVNTNQDVSAELYCSTDVLNYDNFDWISPVEGGKTYYCVGFNAPIASVTINKVVVGTSTPVSAFPLLVDDTSVTSGVPTPFAGGSYFVHELNGADYTPTFSGDCVADESNPARLAQIVDFKAKRDAIQASINADPENPLNPERQALIEDINNKIEALGAAIGASLTVTPGQSYTCTITNTWISETTETDDNGGGDNNNPPANPPTGGGGNPNFATFGGGGGSVLGASTGGQVLGASCGLYMNKYIRLGKKNDVEQVKKLQQFLNKNGYGPVPVTGFYGPLTFAAVVKFQKDHLSGVLSPWGIASPTGIVYRTTLRQINMMECPELTSELPELVEWSKAKDPNKPN